MKAETFIHILGAEFFTGVPDSLLKPLCDYLMDTYGADGPSHVIAPNEGCCTAIAAGYHLATGKIPLVYMQNSGQGNAVNPIASLLHDQVYGIPCIFVIGWRGEPGVHDEPQHIYQGRITEKLMEDLEIPSFILSKDTSPEELELAMDTFRPLLAQGRQAAVIVRKGALSFDKKLPYRNDHPMTREEIISHVLAVSGTDPIVSTTGKASRELFELREAAGQHHGYDFLTVGSMGHSSSIALGIALQKPQQRVWILDGDGAALMHLGAMALLGSRKPDNIVHILINNGAHETVGGQPTALANADLASIAKGCGYPEAVSVATAQELDAALHAAVQRNVLQLIEVKCAIGARSDLGRPTTTAKENKLSFMACLQEK